METIQVNHITVNMYWKSFLKAFEYAYEGLSCRICAYLHTFPQQKTEKGMMKPGAIFFPILSTSLKEDVSKIGQL